MIFEEACFLRVQSWTRSIQEAADNDGDIVTITLIVIPCVVEVSMTALIDAVICMNVALRETASQTKALLELSVLHHHQHNTRTCCTQ